MAGTGVPSSVSSPAAKTRRGGGWGTGSAGGTPRPPPSSKPPGMGKLRHDPRGPTAPPHPLTGSTSPWVPHTPATAQWDGRGPSSQAPSPPAEPLVTRPSTGGAGGARGPPARAGGVRRGRAGRRARASGSSAPCGDRQKVGHVCLGRRRNSSGGFKTQRPGLGCVPPAPPHHATGRPGPAPWPPSSRGYPGSAGMGARDAAPSHGCGDGGGTPRRCGVSDG